MNTYRAALIGTGSIADAHVKAVEATDGRVELVAAVDLDPARVNDFCRQRKIPVALTSTEQLFAEVRPDLVFVATPPHSHASLSIAAMEAGAWVLCEKPLCASLADLDRIAAAEQRTGRYTACVFQMRFASSNIHLRRLMEQGLLGRPLVGVCNTLWYRDEAYYQVPWRGRWETEVGGPTMGHGIHQMDHLLDLMGDWTDVRACADTLDRAIEVEDVSMAIVRFANGAMATVINSILSPRQETYLRFDYQRATVELTHHYAYSDDHWRLTLPEGAQDEALMKAWADRPPSVGSTHGAQLNALVANMDHHTRPATSGPAARQTLELLTAIYKSAFTGEIVKRGSIVAGDPFYTALHGHSAPARRKGDPPASVRLQDN